MQVIADDLISNIDMSQKGIALFLPKLTKTKHTVINVRYRSMILCRSQEEKQKGK